MSLYCYAVLLHLHSFPTRRSSDLVRVSPRPPRNSRPAVDHKSSLALISASASLLTSCHKARPGDRCSRRDVARLDYERSEEHTSELQSHSDLVCRLLLEKKKYCSL